MRRTRPPASLPQGALGPSRSFHEAQAFLESVRRATASPTSSAALGRCMVVFFDIDISTPFHSTPCAQFVSFHTRPPLVTQQALTELHTACSIVEIAHEAWSIGLLSRDAVMRFALGGEHGWPGFLAAPSCARARPRTHSWTANPPFSESTRECRSTGRSHYQLRGTPCG